MAGAGACQDIVIVVCFRRIGGKARSEESHEQKEAHYEEGTFHYDTMAFGEITHDNDELIDLLIDYMQHDCVMKEKYRKRADDFFAFNDNNNCQRIYDVMIDYQQRVIDKNR